jgi:hypothetical protein
MPRMRKKFRVDASASVWSRDLTNVRQALPLGELCLWPPVSLCFFTLNGGSHGALVLLNTTDSQHVTDDFAGRTSWIKKSTTTRLPVAKIV